MRASKARTGRSTGYAWYRRWLAYGAQSPWIPEVGTVCGKAARTDLCGGREVTRVPTATSLALVSQTDAELQSLLAQGTDGTFHRS